MNGYEGVYAEIDRMADALMSRADVRSRPLNLRSVELSTLYNLRMGSVRLGDFDKATLISHEIVKRECAQARVSNKYRAHAQAVLALVSMLRQTASSLGRDKTHPARAMSLDLAAGLKNPPQWLTNYLKSAPKSAKASDVMAITGLSVDDWNSFVVKVVAATSHRVNPQARIGDGAGPVDLNVAARLSRIATRDTTTVVEPPVYSTVDRDLKVLQVAVTGFRGSPSTLALDLTKNGAPADVLLWGDNGVGKSTLVDGLEFALQHRVDRSSDFNSSLRPAVRNLTVPSAIAEVSLSDGSVSTRSLVTNQAGRDEPSSLEVRAGFRIAPLVIRRADILRFLDTDALSRGTVFFDYFPDPAGTVGVRPDEELRQLEEERFLLKVARDDLATQLADLYPDFDGDLSNASELERFVTEGFAESHEEDAASSLSGLPQETRRIVEELRNAQKRGQVVKRTLQRGVETLNPRAYSSQLARVVPTLETATADLTSSFKRIARADHVVSIRVLVAKSGPVSLDIVVEFENGSSALPQQAFSEGYRDLIALLFFLTVSKKAAELGQAKVLVLDDALQSVDAEIRLGVMAYVLEEFSDWQLIVTGHDRAWLAQLRGLFQRRGRRFLERTITKWSFAHGPEISTASFSRADSLRAALERADDRMVASGAGLLLEETANELSWRLMTSVTRREGDRYTLGDLWPSVAKALRKTQLSTVIESIDMRLDIRNLLGAHYNDWADSIPWSDIRQLGEDVLEVYNSTHCSDCASWVRKARSGSPMVCGCGALAVA